MIGAQHCVMLSGPSSSLVGTLRRTRPPLFLFQVLQLDAASGAKAVPRLFNAPKETRVVLETVFEPVLFRFETDQRASRFAMTRDNDLLRLGLSKVAGQIVLDLSKAGPPSLRISVLCEP